MIFRTIESTGSTNEELKKTFREDREEWTTLFSFTQTQGKGSKGREFVSPYGGAYFSFVFFPDKDTLPLVTPLAAEATREIIYERYGCDCKIKWVNDLYYNGKKVCGILTESKTEGEKTVTIVGIGVNLFKSPSGYGKYADKAGFILDSEVDREESVSFAASVVNRVRELSKNADFMDNYIKNSLLTGKEVYYTDAGITSVAKVIGVNSDGSIELSFDSGKKKVFSGEIIMKE
ncbi:MAG: biotin--[acetyl-CoA-carboxylase] ligase [Christensenellales bacterium]